ncbi:MAG: hypothetical protein WBK76_00400 [Candidatus Saccharimonadales bacterium]
MARKIKSLEELRRLAKDDAVDVYIRLNGGVRSSKHIQYVDNEWCVCNFIDDSEETFSSDAGLDEGTLIVKAIKSGNLILD